MTAAEKTLTLDVWQFVRLMVRMEETLQAGDGSSALRQLYERWEDLWVDLDARLVDLGRTDMDAFADLMMEQEVVLEDVPPGAYALVADELEKVTAELKRTLSHTEDPAQVEDLSFERDEISLTVRALRGGAKGAPGKPGRPKSDAAASKGRRKAPAGKGPAGKGPAKRPGGERAARAGAKAATKRPGGGPPRGR
ncbi:MAG: hypothetical protein RIB45_06205 [Marivibrio sp.]|uniref:hypothetical protein n=1 Tax=Marivibrio sp. TaxID=2039719 RepID=UPI0032EAC1A7